MTDPFDLQRFVAAQDPVFQQVLQRYYGGEHDAHTLALL